MSDSFDFDWQAMERSHDELNPDLIEQRRRDELAQKRRNSALKMQSDVDLRALMTLPHFRRYMFTVLAKAGIYRAAFHPHEGALQYSEGRRGLGIELLDDLLREDADFALDMTREQAKLEQKVNDAIQQRP